MIPRIIHYCWLSNEPKPKTVRACLKSWKRYFPDYQIKCWDMDSFDFDSVPFTREALAARKWAFVADYIRLYALYEEGGIYLDSDVMAFGIIDEWLKYDFFSGVETRDKELTDLWIEAAIMGACPNNPMLKKMLELYNSRLFVRNDGTLDLTPIPNLITPIIEDCLGWERNVKTQLLNNNSIVFGIDSIANSNVLSTPGVKLYHLNNRSWIPMTHKEKLISFFKVFFIKP